MDHLNNVWLEHPQKGVYRCQLSDDYSSFRDFTYYGKNEENELPYKLSLFKVGGKIAMLGNDTFYTYNEIEDAIVPWEPLNTCFRTINGLEKVIQINFTHFWALSQNAVYKFYFDGYKAEILENYNLGMNFSLVHGFENISIANDSINIICLDNGMLYYKQPEEGAGHRDHIIPVAHLGSFEMVNLNGNRKYQSLTDDIIVPYQYNSVNLYFPRPGFTLLTSIFNINCPMSIRIGPDRSGRIMRTIPVYRRANMNSRSVRSIIWDTIPHRCS